MRHDGLINRVAQICANQLRQRAVDSVQVI